MAPPFPGMDPYLEGSYWTEFHTTLASAIRAQILAQIRPNYVALLEKRYVIQRPLLGIFDRGRPIYPDVAITQTPRRLAETAIAYRTRTISPPTWEAQSLAFEEVPITNVAIRAVDGQRLVTVIEILSPANKIGEGKREYMERREQILDTPTHLLELDLVRRGGRIPLEPMPPHAPYYAYLSRMEHRPKTSVWAIQLTDILPVLPVPLLPSDEDAVLDLQEAVNDCFELVGYEQLLDYTQLPPEPRLTPNESAWMQSHLEAHGLRSPLPQS